MVKNAYLCICNVCTDTEDIFNPWGVGAVPLKPVGFLFRFGMQKTIDFIYAQIDAFGNSYSSSPIVDQLISLRKKVSPFIWDKEKKLREFYRNGTNKNISFVLKWGVFGLRTTFYPDGNMRVCLNHANEREKLMKDAYAISEYCMDVGSVYFIESEFGWKIGKTRNIANRKRTFSVKLPFKFAVRFHIKTIVKTDVERALHDYFKDKKINGEWFLITESDIKTATSELNYPLSNYSPDKDVFIDQKYLLQLPASD